MLRNDTEVAINDLLVHCESSAQQLRHSAELMKNHAQSALLIELAERHEQHAEELRNRLQRWGKLPDTADEDRLTVKEFKDKITALFSRQGLSAVIRHRAEEEARLAQMADQSLRLFASPDGGQGQGQGQDTHLMPPRDTHLSKEQKEQDTHQLLTQIKKDAQQAEASLRAHF